MSARLLILPLLLACTEYRVQPPEPVPPAEPPGREDDAFGSPPDWSTCSEAFLGQYYNLEWNTPGMAEEVVDTGGETVLVLDDPDPQSAPWWDPDGLSFQRYDVSLAWGEQWWPVDEDLTEDPDFFAVRWTAWLRALDGNGAVIALGATTDGWVMLDDEIVASVEGARTYAPENVSLGIRAGVYPLDVRMVHRGGGDAAFRFRVVSGNVAICYPEFSEE